MPITPLRPPGIYPGPTWGRGGAEGLHQLGMALLASVWAVGLPRTPDDIHLTRAQEARMRAVGRARVQAADRTCFDAHLKGVVSTKPLSAYAIGRAISVLKELSACMKSFGYTEGRPVVRNMSEGRAFFGFDAPAHGGPPGWPQARAQRTCEQRVQMAHKLDAIVKADRGPY